MPVNRIICGDCMKIVPKLPKATMIFADPPDNLKLKYNGFNDKWPDIEHYADWLRQRFMEACITRAPLIWVSVYFRNLLTVWAHLENEASGYGYKDRLFLWRFTFGQHNHKDCGNGYRPILRFSYKDAILYPDEIRVPSKRQTLYNDKRANPRGRVPDDVWEFPRVCGTFSERRQWHPNQHPEALIERIVKFSTAPGDLVIDMFAGTGTVNRVCERLGRSCIGIEISPFYCRKIAEETGSEYIGYPVDGEKCLGEKTGIENED